MPEFLIPMVIVVSLLAGLFLGLPIAFGLSGISAILILVLFGPESLFMIINAAYSQVGSDILICIPLFVLMACALELSGIANELYNAMHIWAAGLKGGLAIGTLVICAILAAMSGVAATGTVVMGVLALPEMRQRGYNKIFAIGPIVLGGALGVLIPPSILMVIIGNLSTISVGMLLIGGIVPGLLVVLLSCIYIYIVASLRPNLAPALPIAERGTIRDKLKSLKAVILPILLIIAVLGSIYSGITTATEAASVGAAGAFLCGFINRTLSWAKVKTSLVKTLVVTSLIIWVVIGGSCYSQLLVASGVSQFIFNLLSGWQVSPFVILGIMLLIIFIAGMLIDPIAICMIFIPIFLPIALHVGFDPLWFMLLFAYDTVLGYITPPFGANLFYMRGITANTDITTMDIYRSVTPYVVIMTVVLLACVFYPSLLTWLPNRMIE